MRKFNFVPLHNNSGFTLKMSPLDNSDSFSHGISWFKDKVGKYIILHSEGEVKNEGGGGNK